MNRDFKGIWIPKEIWLHKKLSIQAKALWAEIYVLYSEEHGGCYASDDYLLGFLGVRLSRFKEILKELRDVGFVENISFNGRNRVMKAIYPDVNGGQQVAGKPASSQPENRLADSRKTGFSPYIENIDKKKEEREKTPPPHSSNKKTPSVVNTLPPSKKIKYGDHVELKEGEYESLCKSIGKELTEHYIEAINNWVPNNKPKKDYAATIRSWYTKDKASGTLPKAQNLRSVAQASEGSMEKNKLICELVEKKLGHLFNERVFFQAGPSSGVLINTNKDIKKEFVYEKFEPADLKEMLLREMEICFPGAQAILLGTKKQSYSESLGEMINDLSGKFKTQE